MANARVDQQAVVTLGPLLINARVDQATVLIMGPYNSVAHVDQQAIITLGPPVINARANQDAVLILGEPIVNARVDQDTVLTIGAPGGNLTAPYTFAGLIKPTFYALTQPGAELVPIAEFETVVVSGFGMVGAPSATITTDGTWTQWTPANGPLEISFSNSQPVRSIWFPQPGLIFQPVSVWASSEFHTPYKQKFGLI